MPIRITRSFRKVKLLKAPDETSADVHKCSPVCTFTVGCFQYANKKLCGRGNRKLAWRGTLATLCLAPRAPPPTHRVQVGTYRLLGGCHGGVPFGSPRTWNCGWTVSMFKISLSDGILRFVEHVGARFSTAHSPEGGAAAKGGEGEATGCWRRLLPYCRT